MNQQNKSKTSSQDEEMDSLPLPKTIKKPKTVSSDSSRKDKDQMAICNFLRGGCKRHGKYSPYCKLLGEVSCIGVPEYTYSKSAEDRSSVTPIVIVGIIIGLIVSGIWIYIELNQVKSWKENFQTNRSTLMTGDGGKTVFERTPEGDGKPFEMISLREIKKN